MIDYAAWPRKRMLVTSIKLDDANPRLPRNDDSKSITQPQIIDYMVEKEKAYELAKDIARQGYFPNEEPIVYKEGRKYVVVEGNRRITACKILINPELLKSKAKRRNLYKLLKNFDAELIRKLHVRVAPSREMVDVVIVNRHSSGLPIEKWDKTKQDRFFHSRFLAGESIEDLAEKFNLSKSEVKEKLKRFNVYQELLNLNFSESERKAVEDEPNFNMTNIERFYNSTEGAKFLGIKFNEDCEIIHQLPPAEYRKRLKKISVEVINNRLNSRTYNKEQDKKKFIEKLEKSGEFDLNLKPNKKYEQEYEDEAERATDDSNQPNENPKPKKRSQFAPKNKLIPSNIRLITGIHRIDRIFNEIKKADITKQFDSTAILFRSYLDMIVYQYLLKNDCIKEIKKEEHLKFKNQNDPILNGLKNYIVGLGVTEEAIEEKKLSKYLKLRTGISPDWIPSLKHMLAYLSRSEELLPDGRLRAALAAYIKGKDSTFLGHNDFNLFVHNEYYIKSGDHLKLVWDQLQPVILYIDEQLNKQS